MTLDELRDYIREEYGSEGLRTLPARLERVEKNGTSSLHGSTLESLLCVNRAGPGEKKATLKQIIKRYAPADCEDHEWTATGNEEIRCDECGTLKSAVPYIGDGDPK